MSVHLKNQTDRCTPKNNVTNKKKRFCKAEMENEAKLDDSKLCFVHWYEILKRQKLAVTSIDKATKRLVAFGYDGKERQEKQKFYLLVKNLVLFQSLVLKE